MIARLLLAVLGLGLAVAQQEYLMYTAGRAGVECGKIHKCITDAKCVKDEQQKEMCQCKNDTESGNGKLHCAPKEDPKVTIQNDPHLKNFKEESANLATPCQYRLLNLVFKPEVDTRAVVELYGENTLFKGGNYFLTKLTLSNTVYLGNDLMKQIMEFEGDIRRDPNQPIDQSYNYTLIGRSLDTSIVVRPADVENVVDSDDSRFIDFNMVVDKDDRDNLLKVEIKALGIKVFFRPPSMQEDIDNVELPLVPGAVFTVKSEDWEKVDISESQYDLAAWPQGPTLKEKAEELKVSIPVYEHYLLLSNSTTELGFEDEICAQNKEIFDQECKTDQDKFDMLKPCHAIYAEKKFLECLTRQHTMEEYKMIHKQFFQECVASLCNKDVERCSNMKSESPSLTSCPLPEKIKELDCDSIREPVQPTPAQQPY